MKLGLIVAAATLTALAAGARADIIFTPGPGNFTGDENVLFNQGSLIGTGTTVQGETQQSNFVVNFTSPTSLTTPAQGQARITGETANYSDLTISLADPNASFKTLILNINAATAGDVSFGVTEPVGGPNTFSSTVDASGQNFFRFEAVNGQAMKSVSFSSPTPLLVQDVRQIRIGGLTTGGGAIPEPGSLALLATGLLPGLAVLRRRRA